MHTDRRGSVFGELSGSSLSSGRRHSVLSLRRGSVQVGENLEQTIHLTSQSSAPSAYEEVGDFEIFSM